MMLIINDGLSVPHLYPNPTNPDRVIIFNQLTLPAGHQGQVDVLPFLYLSFKKAIGRQL